MHCEDSGCDQKAVAGGRTGSRVGNGVNLRGDALFGEACTTTPFAQYSSLERRLYMIQQMISFFSSPLVIAITFEPGISARLHIAQKKKEKSR